MLVLSTISVLQILMQSAIITDNIRLHEGDEVVHGGVHTLLHPGHCQVSAIEKAMDAGKSVLIKICLKNGDMINVSIFEPSSDRLYDLLRQTAGSDRVWGLPRGHEVLGAGDVAVHLRRVLPVGLHHAHVAGVHGHAASHQVPPELGRVHHHVGAEAGADRPHPPGAPLQQVGAHFELPVLPDTLHN